MPRNSAEVFASSTVEVLAGCQNVLENFLPDKRVSAQQSNALFDQFILIGRPHTKAWGIGIEINKDD